jgi:glycosyl transferase family 87
MREGPAGRETAERPALLRPGPGRPEGDAERGSRRGRVRGTADAEGSEHEDDGCEEPSHAVSVAPCRRSARYRLAVHAATARRIVLAVAAVLVAAVVLVGASRASTHVYHDDSVWANALSSLGGVGEPYDFAIFLHAGNDVLAGRNPYTFTGSIEAARSPYAYPPVLAFLVSPLAALPERAVRNTFVPGALFSLVLLAATVGSLLLIGVSDWRCYPIALVSPLVAEPVEFGAVGPLLLLLVALAWRYRDRSGLAGTALGGAAVLKLFLAPLVLWLAFTRRVRAALLAVAVAVGLALVSWAAIAFRGLSDYPHLLRKLNDVEADNSYSTFAVLRALDVPKPLAQAVVLACGIALLVLAARAARAAAADPLERDRRSLILTLAAAFVLTPILWLHYLVLLLLPIGLTRPRLALLWAVPLAFGVFEWLDWYRGWPRGDGKALASVALLVALTFVVSLRKRPRGREPQIAPAHA